MKKGLAVLLALVLTLSLAGCGKKNDTDAPGDDDAIPETPIKLETLHVEFVKGERDVDDLLALKDTLPLVAALSERNVEVGSAAVTFGTSAEATAQALAAERAFLTALDGSCRTPIAGLAQIDGDELSFYGEVLKADGTQTFVVRRKGRAIDAAMIGADAGNEIVLKLPHGVAGLM